MDQKPREVPTSDSEAFIRIRAARFIKPELVLSGLEGLRPDLARQLANIDAAEHEGWSGEDETRFAHELELDLMRAVLKAHLTWLNRAEKRFRSEILRRKRLGVRSL